MMRTVCIGCGGKGFILTWKISPVLTAQREGVRLQRGLILPSAAVKNLELTLELHTVLH
jgi:hypothetical protein